MNRDKPTRSPASPTGFAQRFNSELTAWAVLGLSLCLTLLAWAIAQQAVQERVQDRFVHEVDDAKDRIETRMRKYEQALRGGAALFTASQTQSHAPSGKRMWLPWTCRGCCPVYRASPMLS